MNVFDTITPRIEIDLEKIAHNAKTLNKLYGSKGITITGVTKVVCGAPKIADVLVKNGMNILADSRISNIIRMREAGIQAQFLLLRTPISSQVESVVRFTDVSHNSELSVIKGLSNAAIKQGITHEVILMVELGDLREGLMPSDLENTVEEIIVLKGIELVGVGTNMACFGGIEPDQEKMEYLSTIVKNIEEKF